MKFSSRFFSSSTTFPALTSAFLLTLLAVGPSPAQQPGKNSNAAAVRQAFAANKPSADTADAPASRQGGVAVMVEFLGAPAASAYAEALRNAQQQVDIQRNFALAHPGLRSSRNLLAKPAVATTINATASRQVANKWRQLEDTQKAVLPNLTGSPIGGRVLFRATRAYNGIALVVTPDKIEKIAALPGVKAVHPLRPESRNTAFSDIDFIGVRAFWAKPPFGLHGENIRIADIDSGLDYIHANFGGPGSPGYALVPNHNAPTSAPNPFFPTQKVPGGYDFAGDNYNADLTDPAHAPNPDPDPFDCGDGGHGTGTASLIAGYGVTSAGFTYSGSYDAVNPAAANLAISPGMAPNAKLFPLKVFGCSGTTNLVIPAIEWAMDPNGDGNFNDRLDVINMSLGHNEGLADDSDAIAASNASAIGILVCSAAGNAGDTYYVHSGPAAASGTLSVAATFNDQNGFIYNGIVTVNQPPALAGHQFVATKSSGSPATPGGSITGDVVYGIPNDAGPATTPALATPLTNAAQCAGKIVLLDRGGGVSFEQKVRRSIASGAIGVIIANNANNPRNDFPPINVGLFFDSTIPEFGISKNDGDAFKAAAAFDPTDGHSTSIPPANVTLTDTQGTFSVPGNPPGTAAGTGSSDTVPSYTSRGPRLPDSALKPDVAAPAEVTGVAESSTGNHVMLFNGTSSATPHVSGVMALLRQEHPTWTVQELNALICGTAAHDLATTAGGTTKIGVGRIGAGRVDLNSASIANVVAYNGTDPNLIGVSFGAVEVPVDGSRTLTKTIKVVNKSANDVTYNITYADSVAASGASFTVPNSITVPAGSSGSFNVTFTATGSQLRHERDLSTSTSQATSFGTFSRQYLTEKAGYAVLTPASGSEPVQRVALYAAPKPSSSMHVATTAVVPDAASGSFSINLSGAGINTGSSFPTDIVSYAKAFELQYANPLAGAPNAPTDPNVIKYVGITSDWANRTSAEQDSFVPWLNFAIEGFGNATVPDFNSSDKEIFIDLDFDNTYDVAIFLTRFPNGTSPTNVYMSELVDLTGVFGPAGNAYFWEPTNARSPAPTARDTNTFNNSVITVPIDGLIGTGFTSFQYQVVTFDRNGSEVDETPVLFFDAAAPGFNVNPPGALEPFFVNDLPTTSFNVAYNGTGFQTNGSLGLMVVHMHNGTGQHTDVVSFRAPTISGFSPASGHVGDFITITGSNFGPGTKVTFFKSTAPFSVDATELSVLTPNTISVRVPAGAASGPIRVSNAAGSSTKGGFTVLP